MQQALSLCVFVVDKIRSFIVIDEAIEQVNRHDANESKGENDACNRAPKDDDQHNEGYHQDC